MYLLDQQLFSQNLSRQQILYEFLEKNFFTFSWSILWGFTSNFKAEIGGIKPIFYHKLWYRPIKSAFYVYWEHITS